VPPFEEFATVKSNMKAKRGQLGRIITTESTEITEKYGRNLCVLRDLCGAFPERFIFWYTQDKFLNTQGNRT
jgi:hypothetical protein